ncbi:MAG: hypothetical protein WA734_15525 [Candidatus Acidiferrales bacterium]
MNCWFVVPFPPAQKQVGDGPAPGAGIKTTAVVVNVYPIVEGRRGRLILDLDRDG